MNTEDDGVKDIGEVQAPSESPADKADFYNDIPEPTGESEPQEETESKEEPVQDEKPEKSGKSAQSRIRELNTEKKEAERRALEAERREKSLAEKMAELTGRFSPAGTGIPYAQPTEPQVNEDGTIDAESFRKQVLAEAANMYEVRSLQERNLERINKESQQVMTTYKQLNPDSEQYDSDLSESIYEATEAFVRANPTGSVTKYVEKLMKPYQRSIEREVGEQAKTIAQQAADRGLRPTVSPKGEKRFEELSLEEMEQRLGKVY